MEKRSLKQRQNETLKIGIILGILFFLFALFISGSHLIHQRAEGRLREELNKQPYKVPLEPGNDRLIEWNDMALEQDIRRILKKEEGDIYLSDLWDYNTLYLVREPGFDDPGVDAVGNTIKDISCLSGLENLKTLFLTANDITDIAAIGAMKNMVKLSLGGNPVQDISPIASLTELYYLNLNSMNLKGEDLNYLSNLKNLRMLELNFNENENLHALCNLQLSGLFLERNQISDISPLTGLKETLLYLNLDTNQIADIEPLTEAGSLRYLSLEHNFITDIKALEQLNKLCFLCLTDNEIRSLPDFSGMSSLTRLYLADNDITTEEWKKIKLPMCSIQVNISGNPITDLETEQDYPNLQVIFDY